MIIYQKQGLNTLPINSFNTRQQRDRGLEITASELLSIFHLFWWEFSIVFKQLEKSLKPA